MKLKTVIIALSILVVGCAQQLTSIPQESHYYGVDFTKYTERGFLITPEKFLDEYESVGTVRYILIPSANYVTINRSVHSDGSVAERKQWVSRRVTLAQGLDSLYTMARSMGANAIINFEAKEATRSYPSLVNPITLSGYELSGFAIRRKQK